jgi:hypothetical protein
MRRRDKSFKRIPVGLAKNGLRGYGGYRRFLENVARRPKKISRVEGAEKFFETERNKWRRSPIIWCERR